MDNQQQNLEKILNSILKKIIICVKKIIHNDQIYKDFTKLLIDFSNNIQLANLILNITTFMDARFEIEIKTIKNNFESRYKDIEMQLQKQEQINRQFIKREFQMKQNVDTLTEELYNAKFIVKNTQKISNDLIKQIDDLKMEKQQILNKKQLDLKEKDLIINVKIELRRNYNKVQEYFKVKQPKQEIKNQIIKINVIVEEEVISLLSPFKRRRNLRQKLKRYEKSWIFNQI